MKALMILLLAVIFLSSLLLYKASRALSVSELRRRARSRKNPASHEIYKLVSCGNSLNLFLWTIGALSAAGLFLLGAKTAWWLGLLFVLLASWLVLSPKPTGQPGGWLWWLAGRISAPVTMVVSFLQPLLGWLALPKKDAVAQNHSGLYEKEDLLELIDHQAAQIDNRITAGELRLAKNALTFGDKLVSSVMTPRRDIKWVAAGESIGPLLMDELHKTGHKRFPVVKEIDKKAEPEVIGMLSLRDLLKNLENPGTVRDIMKKDAYFINESNQLRQALDAFIKCQHHLLVVVNNFEEVAGILTLEDVLEQILGQQITSEFDQYEDLKAVAGLDPQKEQHQHSDTKVVE